MLGVWVREVLYLPLGINKIHKPNSCKAMLPFTLRFSTSFIAFPFLLAEKFPQRAENVGQSKKSSVHIFLQCTIKTMSTSSTQFLTWSTSAYFFKLEKKPEAGT